MHRAAQDIVEARFPAEYEREAVQRVIPVVHQHFYVIQDARGQVLRFIDRKNYKVPIDLAGISGYNGIEVIYLLGMAFAFPPYKKEVYG